MTEELKTSSSKEKYPGLAETINNEWNPAELQLAVEACQTIEDLIDTITNSAVSVNFLTGPEKALVYNVSDDSFFTAAELGAKTDVPFKLRSLIKEIEEARLEFRVPESLSNAGGKFEQKILELLKQER